ncbi:MAG: nucleotidyltransferase family protein [Chloroflexi bacterium]|nr:nucleotidyltransferase family protein [Chloroflexota bacterium]
MLRQAPIQRLSVFGSAARNELTPESDIDLLVEYDPDAAVGLFAIGGHLMDLQEIVGRKVDLITPNGLCKYIRDEVPESARLVYAKEPTCFCLEKLRDMIALERG